MTPSLPAWGVVPLAAAGALLAVYLYAAFALHVHARLPALAPPRGLAHALLVGARVPACGCTALAYARRAAPPLRAPFLVAAYAASPLLLAAAWLLAGPLAALAVLGLALLVALLARVLVPGGAKPRTRLDDLLLRRDARPLRDALPYVWSFGAPAAAVGALVGGATLAHPALAGLAAGALAALLGAPHAEVAQDHGDAFAWRLRALHAAFALSAGLAVGALA